MTSPTSTQPVFPALDGSKPAAFLPRRTDPSKTSSWFEALAKAWGQVLDKQAGEIAAQSESIDSGSDRPSDLVQLTAAASKMQFLANSSSTSLGSVGNSLETMARKS